MTVKDIVTTLVSFYGTLLLAILHVSFNVARGFCRIFSNTFMGGNLVEGAKIIKVTELCIYSHLKKETMLKVFQT